MFWDVLKVAKLDALKPATATPNIGNLTERSAKACAASASTKAGRVAYATNTAGKLPPSFTTTSPKEARALAYAGDFKRVFGQLYPHRCVPGWADGKAPAPAGGGLAHCLTGMLPPRIATPRTKALLLCCRPTMHVCRRPLFLMPPNECGVPKLVCSTLRPCQLPYAELYDLPGAAGFVADFLAHEPLAGGFHPPAALPSPASVLSWQTGDAFDAATLLASLLLGAGYDAYVVAGYAPEGVVARDLSGEECPLPLDVPAPPPGGGIGAAVAAAASAVAAAGGGGEEGGAGAGGGAARRPAGGAHTEAQRNQAPVERKKNRYVVG